MVGYQGLSCNPDGVITSMFAGIVRILAVPVLKLSWLKNYQCLNCRGLWCRELGEKKESLVSMVTRIVFCDSQLWAIQCTWSSYRNNWMLL